MSWPTRPVISRKPLKVIAPMTVTATYAMTTVASGAMLPLPPSRSGGMPLSIPISTSHGPVSWATVLIDDQHRGREQRPPVRSHQRREQHAAAAAEESGEPGARLVDVLRRDAAPRVDPRVAGQVQRAGAVDVGELVRLEVDGVHAERSCGSSSAAWLRMAA